MTTHEPTFKLIRDVLLFIGNAYARTPAENTFNNLALRVFRYQHTLCAPYRTLCNNLNIQVSTIKNWSEIPPVPVDAFRQAEMTTFPPAQAARTFRSSSTTSDMQSIHQASTLALYEGSIIPHFIYCCLPEGSKISMRLLSPLPEEETESSLSFMLGLVAERFGTPDSRSFIQGRQLDHLGLQSCLESDARGEKPVMLLGPAFAFLHFLDKSGSRRWKLPSGSRIMETGGYKGRSRELPRGEFYDLLSTRFGIPVSHIISEYGMTELFSQLYDNGYRNFVKGIDAGNALIAPPWCKVRIVDPDTLTEVKPGEEGLFAFFDLANLEGVSSIVTMDIGRQVEGGFQFVRRVEGASPKGCSLAMDLLLSGNG